MLFTHNVVSRVNYAENYTRKMFDLLTFAYSTITVSDAAHFLGMSEEDATKCMFILIFCTIILGILPELLVILFSTVGKYISLSYSVLNLQSF
jgi:hypothetical protein